MMKKVKKISDLSLSVSERLEDDKYSAQEVESILVNTLDVIIDELKNNNTVHLDRFFSFFRKNVKRNRFVSQPMDGEKSKTKISYYSTIRAKPLTRASDELIIEIDKEEYDKK